jgi:hypothetical protein
LLTLTMLALGGTALLVSASRDWVSAGSSVDQGLQASHQTLGAAVPLVHAVGLLALAAVAGLLATRGLARRVVGVAVLLAAVATVWATLVASPGTSGGSAVQVHEMWRASAVIAAFVVGAAGLLVATMSSTWPTMSGRYSEDRPRAATDDNSALAMWNAIDRGEDPTAGRSGQHAEDDPVLPE